LNCCNVTAFSEHQLQISIKNKQAQFQNAFILNTYNSESQPKLEATKKPYFISLMEKHCYLPDYLVHGWQKKMAFPLLSKTERPNIL